MKDLRGKEVNIGDEVAFVTTGYCHRVSLRVGTVVKIRVYWDKEVPSVEWTDNSPIYDRNIQAFVPAVRRRISSMKLPRIILLDQLSS